MNSYIIELSSEPVESEARIEEACFYDDLSYIGADYVSNMDIPEEADDILFGHLERFLKGIALVNREDRTVTVKPFDDVKPHTTKVACFPSRF